MHHGDATPERGLEFPREIDKASPEHVHAFRVVAELREHGSPPGRVGFGRGVGEGPGFRHRLVRVSSGQRPVPSQRRITLPALV